MAGGGTSTEDGVSALDTFIDVPVDVAGLVQVPFVKVQQPPGHLQQVKDHRKKTPETAELTVLETIAAGDNVSVKG